MRESLSFVKHHLKVARSTRSHEDLELAARELTQIMRCTGAFPVLLNLHIAVSRAQLIISAVSDSEEGGDAVDDALLVCWTHLRRLMKGSEVI